MNDSFLLTPFHTMYYAPYYEMNGPDYEYVRRDMYNKHLNKVNNAIGFKSQHLRCIIEKHIHSGIRDFGSWRGYASFGLDPTIKKALLKDIHTERFRLAANKIGVWYQYYKWFI